MARPASALSFSDLSEKEQAALEKVYGKQAKSGYSRNQIEFVRPLTSRESWFFGDGNFLDSSFVTQTIYKVSGTLLPLRFNRALNEIDQQYAVLRMNYCKADDRVFAVVQETRSNVKDAVVYQHLAEDREAAVDIAVKKAAESEFRRPMDLERDMLVHFFIYHTGKDEYAVIVTAAQIILDFLDVKALLRMAMGLPNQERKPLSPFFRGVHMEAKLRDYWLNLLSSPPKPLRLPGMVPDEKVRSYKQKVFRAALPVEILKQLSEGAQDSRLMMTTILATAWGFMLQFDGNIRDLCICLTVPELGASGKDDIWKPFNMFPVRLKTADGEKISDIVQRQFRQLLASRPYACFDWEGFGVLLGRKNPPFIHYLDFCDFLSEDKPFSSQNALPDGNVVGQRSWDFKSMKLSVYFHYSGNSPAVDMIYNENAFLPNTGERLASEFFLVLQRMLEQWEEPVEVFLGNLDQKLQDESRIMEARREESRARLRNAVSTIGLLQGSDTGTIQLIMQDAHIITYFEGDRIRGMEKGMLFVLNGQVARSIEDEEGWLHTLNMVRNGAWLNETVLLPERKARISAEVMSEQAQILEIPEETVNNLLVSHPKIWKNISEYALGQLETYQRLWARS